MMKEMNHRFGFYLISTIMIVMLFFIYLDVNRLNADVDALLESSQMNQPFDMELLEQLQSQQGFIDEDIDLTEAVEDEIVEDTSEETE